MLRRDFLKGSAAFAVLTQTPAPSAPTSGSEACHTGAADPNPGIVRQNYPTYAAYLTAKFPVPHLTALTPPAPVSVTLQLQNSLLWHWSDEQQARIQQAALLFQAVWSSQEFKDKVTSVTSLLWHEDSKDVARYPVMISGAVLYGKLMATPQIVMPVKLVKNMHRQTASSGLVSTDMEQGWMDKATVYDLCNTLSHERTHYGAAGFSWDSGHTGARSRYVSYGIGGLTENLAAGYVRCCDDPTLPGSHS